MALKGARKIIVGGKTYQWSFKGKNDRWGNSPLTGHVSIQEHAEKPGRPIVAWLRSTQWVSEDAHDGDTGCVPHVAIVTPTDIHALIVYALVEMQWDPTAKTHRAFPAGIVLTQHVTTTQP